MPHAFALSVALALIAMPALADSAAQATMFAPPQDGA